MRRRSLSLTEFLSLVVVALLAVAAPDGGARAAIVSTGGPNPNWTEIQQYEWYLGYVAQGAQICGAYDDAVVLRRLARMSPYGDIGLSQHRADGFLGNACVRLRAEAKDMAADAQKIEEHLEATYSCSDDGCYGQKLSDWQFHACGNSLKSHFAILDIDDKDIRDVTMMSPAKMGSKAAYLARVQFHSCQGSLYIDLTEQCVMESKQTRGNCEIDGVEGY